MEQKIFIRPNGFLFNAGMLGFLEILKTGEVSEELFAVQNDGIWIDQTLFNHIDFAKLYFYACQRNFGANTAWSELLNIGQRLEQLDPTNEQEIQKIYDRIAAILERASYKSGYEILKNKGDSFDALDTLKQLKSKSSVNVSDKKETALTLIAYVSKYPEVFCFKDIAYTKINRFWTNVAFLYPQSSKKDMLLCFTESFVEPVKLWLATKTSRKNFCIECGMPVTQSEAVGMAWLHEVGIDHKRKKSYFWHEKPDALLCPLCSLIYACSPLGFEFPSESNDAIFINNNFDFKTLLYVRNSLGTKLQGTPSTSLNDISFAVMNSLLDIELELKTNELQNIQVIIKHVGDKYDLNIISKDILEVVKDCQKNLAQLTKRFYLLGKGSNSKYINIYDLVVSNLLNGVSQYGMIHEILQASVDDPQRSVRFLWNCFTIEIRRREGGKKMKQLYWMSTCGTKMRLAMAGPQNVKADGPEEYRKNADNKVRGYAYQLLNALQVRDSVKFMNIISRMYIGMGIEIPRIFLEMMKDDETFQKLGYAYILGLKGEEYVSKNDQGNQNKEGEVEKV